MFLRLGVFTSFGTGIVPFFGGEGGCGGEVKLLYHGMNLIEDS